MKVTKTITITSIIELENDEREKLMKECDELESTNFKGEKPKFKLILELLDKVFDF